MIVPGSDSSVAFHASCSSHSGYRWYSSPGRRKPIAMPSSTNHRRAIVRAGIGPGSIAINRAPRVARWLRHLDDEFSGLGLPRPDFSDHTPTASLSQR